MRLHRFYTTETLAGRTQLTLNAPELIHQIRNVFRMKEGDSIVLFNGTGFDYLCKIDSKNERSTIVSDSVISLRVVETRPERYSPKRRLFLCTAIMKKDTFEWIVEKATELGVTDIIPLSAERSEKKSLNVVRLQKIALEASEQSGRDTTPMVHAIMGPGEAAAWLKKESVGDTSRGVASLIAFHTEGEAASTRRHLVELAVQSNPLAIFIGPEGGWSPTEIEMFHKEDIEVLCLGPQILRSETAVVAALSMVVFG